MSAERPASNVSEEPCQYVIALTGAPCGSRRDAPIHTPGWHDARPDRPVHDYTFTDRRVRDRRSTPASAANVSEGLREALIRAVASTHGYDHPDTATGSWWEHKADPVLEVVRAALAHAAPEGLDVERLYRAILDELAILWGEPSDGISSQVRPILARQIVDRYLSQPDATDEAGREAREAQDAWDASLPDENGLPQPPYEPRDA